MTIDDIAIEITPPSSADDQERKEMLWKTRIEDHITTIRNAASATSGKHEKAAWKARRLYQVFGLLTVLLPLGASVASDYAPVAVNSGLMLAAGIAAGVNSVLNLGAKSRHHFEYQSRWDDLASNVDFELAKSRADRVAADLFLEGLRTRSSSLRASGPPV